jgi:hypothetical protein
MSDTPIDVISDTTAEATITAEAVVEITAEATIETTVGEASEAATGDASEAAKASEAAAINLPVEYILDSIQVDHPMRAAIREELRAQIDPLREQLEALVKLLVR